MACLLCNFQGSSKIFNLCLTVYSLSPRFLFAVNIITPEKTKSNISGRKTYDAEALMIIF